MSDSFFAYCDESDQRSYGPKTDSHFVIASVIAEASAAPHLEDEVRGSQPTSRLGSSGHRPPYSGVKISVAPDLRVHEGSQEKVIKLEFSSEEPAQTEVKVISQVLFEAAQVGRLGIPASLFCT